MPSLADSTAPSESMVPSQNPTPIRSTSPSFVPSFHPSLIPSAAPSVTDWPSFVPTESPLISTAPSGQPSEHPPVSGRPSSRPSSQPNSETPASYPLSSNTPTRPSDHETISMAPTNQPSSHHADSVMPSSQSNKSLSDSATPSLQPSISQAIFVSPSYLPSEQPSPIMSSMSIQPSSSPSASIMPNDSTNEPGLAVYDPLLRVPVCHETGSSCDTGGTMIAGVGSYEPNSPNTIDDCNDQSAAVYQQDESIDRIVVRSKDGGLMTAGSTLEILATVSTAVDVSARSNPGHQETVHMYYHNGSTNGWKYICSKMSPPGVGNFVFSCDFEVPEDDYYSNCAFNCGLQVVRVNYGYGEYAVEACTETGIWVRYFFDFECTLLLCLFI